MNAHLIAGLFLIFVGAAMCAPSVIDRIRSQS